MFRPRRSEDRGHANHGWLDTRYTFSFSSYYDPNHMGFRALRVMNEDFVASGAGFPMHGHRDMEILTYIVAGELEHQDSLGHRETLTAGEMQRITAGSGIRHSEGNPAANPVHLYQIWIEPRAAGLDPSYEQKTFDRDARLGRYQLVASPDGEAGSLTIQADARVYLLRLAAGQDLERAIAAGRHGWLQVITGEVEAEGHALSAGDGAAISDEPTLRLHAVSDTEVLFFDLA